MKIISWNVNGLRAVYKKGFLDRLAEIKPDIACLQEIKTQEEQSAKDYSAYFNFAQKKGYSGLAIYSKKRLSKIVRNIGLKRFDQEGRILETEFPFFTLINLYLPHGGRQKENLKYKLQAYDYLFRYLKKIKNKNLILIGDFNIAHQEIDLARPKQNQHNIMFTLEERKQIDRLIDLGFIDSFRKFHQNGGHYTWWPYRFQARERNLGWRLDYVFVSQNLAPKLKNAFVLPEVQGSDHCPVGIRLALQ